MNDLGEDVGAFGKIYFPNGKQSCSVVLGAKCGGPAFRVNPFLSKGSDQYEIYWAEWDYYQYEEPIQNVPDEQDVFKLVESDWSINKLYPRFDQSFSYEGNGNDKVAGYPGATEEYQNLKVFGDYEELRSQTYGIGQPSTGHYYIADSTYDYENQGVWKAFGAQGQYRSDHEGAMGWKPYHSEQCGIRYMMITVMHKSDAVLTSDSEIVLDI